MSDPGLLKFELVTEEPAVLVANTVYFVKNATVNRIVISGNLPQDPLRVTSTTALENIASKMYIASGNTKEEARNSIDAAAIDHTHPEASGTVPGFLSTALYTKLMGLSNYVHPTSDGNLHVPATGTTNNGKVLKAGATAGSMSWGTLTKNDVGLNNVDNTTDAAKPVSTAQASAIATAKSEAATDATTKANAAQAAAIAASTPVGHIGTGGTSHANATTAVAGFMSETDKTKLDGIATGAQVNAVDSVAGKTGIVTLVKADVGLSNVDNTADTAKPVSTAQASAIATAKSEAATDATTKANTAQAAAIAASAPIAHVGSSGTAHAVVTTSVAGFMSAADKAKLDGIAADAQVNAVNSVAGKTGVVTLVKADVGLGNVDNTSDANKPVSTATQTALDAKAPVSHTHDASAIVSGTIADARLPGRLREVAASITDWNDAQANGWYMAADAANAPISGTWFIGSVENHGAGGWCTQVVHAFSTDSEYDTKTYRRERNNGTWSTWQRCRITEAEQAAVTQAWWDSTAIPISKVTGLQAELDAISGTNTGDETAATIKSKLGITTLSGSNTGDQTSVSGNAGTATKLETARTIGGVSFDGSANIDLPGVNIAGNQNTSGTAERANGLNKTLVINGTNFNGVNDVNVSVGFLNIPLVSASANTLITKTHAGGGLKHPASDTTARTFTIDSNANQNWEDGTTIAIWNVNGTGGVVTIAVNTDTMRLADDGTTGSRSLRRNGFAILVWDIESLSWIISGPGVS